mgnify:CR=1 FL=1
MFETAQVYNAVTMTVEQTSYQPGDLVKLAGGVVHLIEAVTNGGVIQALEILDYNTSTPKCPICAGTDYLENIEECVGRWTLEEIIAAQERFLGYTYGERELTRLARVFANLVTK